MVINGRTDLASESRALWGRSASENAALPGVRAEEVRLNGFSVTAVEILDERGEAALKKPRGHYYTLELPEPFHPGSEVFPRAADALAQLLRRCLEGPRSILIAALGNPDITPDAVGPLAAANLLVTRHLKQSGAAEFAAFSSTALCRTGVLGTTGLESAEQVRALCGRLRPDCVIAIDALAGADLDRLCRCVQLCDTGIAPGSGVGNDREELSPNSLGVPVLAIGVPTVIDAAALSPDAALAASFVTPRDIDSRVRSVSRLIAYGVNLGLHPGLTLADIELLLG